MATVSFLHIKILSPVLQQTAGCQVCLICITCMHYQCWCITRSRNGTCLIMINELIQSVLFNTELRGCVFACADINMLMAPFFCIKPRQQDCFESCWHGHKDWQLSELNVVVLFMLNTCPCCFLFLCVSLWHYKKHGGGWNRKKVAPRHHAQRIWLYNSQIKF